MITWKGKQQPGRHKNGQEMETTVGSTKFWRRSSDTRVRTGVVPL